MASKRLFGHASSHPVSQKKLMSFNEYTIIYISINTLYMLYFINTNCITIYSSKTNYLIAGATRHFGSQESISSWAPNPNKSPNVLLLPSLKGSWNLLSLSLLLRTAQFYSKHLFNIYCKLFVNNLNLNNGNLLIRTKIHMQKWCILLHLHCMTQHKI